MVILKVLRLHSLISLSHLKVQVFPDWGSLALNICRKGSTSAYNLKDIKINKTPRQRICCNLALFCRRSLCVFKI